MTKFRKAKKQVEASDKELFLQVEVFVGTKMNCEKLTGVGELLTILQEHHPDMPLETFVIPIPEDVQSALTMRKAMLSQVAEAFKVHHPNPEDLN